jgi:hypothetical protein
MIKKIKTGMYQLLGTKDHKTMLYIDEQGYLWNYARGIGDLLSFSKHPHARSHVLAQGKYRLYGVKDEPKLVDLQHLELSLGRGQWQGYLLLTGLPTSRRVRRRIVPTEEIISPRIRKGVNSYE